MKILHYTLGLPPYRSGGLVRYAKDLSVEQAKQGHEVSVLYPGFSKIGIRNKSGIIYLKSENGIEFFEISKAFPPPLFHGIKSPQQVVLESEALSVSELEAFFEDVAPEVIHVHTLMSLPLKLIEFFKNKGVKIIFSSHDYFGLCLRVNFVDYTGKVCDGPEPIKCGRCNATASSVAFLKIRNVKILLMLKNIFGRLSSLFIKNIGGIKEQNIEKRFVFSEDDYRDVLNYYHKIFDCIDVFHFNSEVSKSVYGQHIKVDRSVILPVTHNGIKDNRLFRSFQSKQVRFGFIGSLNNYKGFPFFKNTLLNLSPQYSDNWKLSVWGNNNVGKDTDSKNIHYFGKYTSNNIGDVFSTMDILVVPSIWKETFSLIALEALSYGVPILVSQNVGAKSLIFEFMNGAFVFELTDEDLNSKLSWIISNMSVLEDFNKWILKKDFDFSIEAHVHKMNHVYKEF
ncbi:glycosyltransferase [Marinilabilia salmonicolor]|uniref:Glycosyl transferase family 4 n=1 Tax=Marinilabilia salmonicolor TaxID=989 RepID=A0A368UMJ6_9BACT|nr:glycosyltransferase [Marinilabilia salmonicolor]RCW30037.1 glycosyl transferase family 4 [Marinilabilia salmonicolor]